MLAYYDPNDDLILQCDASNKGLGAALIQNGKPIAYKSKALTETEKRFAQIEKEMLALVWELQIFHQYNFDRHVIVHTDHRPKEPLAKAPRRLQAVLLRAHDYNYSVVWKRGKDQVIADLLSRAYSSDSTTLTDSHKKFENINMCSLPIRAERLQNETQSDDILRTLKTVIMQGWPDHKSKCAGHQSVLAPYYSYADELTVQNGVIFEGERVIVPASMRAEMKKDISLIWAKLVVCAGHVNIYSGPGWWRKLSKWYPSVKHVANMRFQSQQKH